ncbi:hypothetical protein BGW36DRAFT_423814 [Talaromyces proteolyticus]|uniref:DUF7025 domain-containing protein n=1 Tax=Talaromyces proteolyticus TaxID=1131652 RepID=A0AAD4KWA7_9EURO|nr:uncharacterized protein BGW36DRAFT_423814 [Talaromyces proteolyticus]KAH8701500.1 hypothetical protein BGW36DRAFT_423814 [Talaromyces proteolyticus]
MRASASECTFVRRASIVSGATAPDKPVGGDNDDDSLRLAHVQDTVSKTLPCEVSVVAPIDILALVASNDLIPALSVVTSMVIKRCLSVTSWEKLIDREYSSVGPAVATEPAQSRCAGNEQEENVQAADESDLKSPICTTLDDFKSFKKWASTTQFKTVVETWDKDATKYKVGELVETCSSLDDYAEYAFVIRERNVTTYIDIKSERLRDILRVVLHDIKAISLMEDKPSIDRNILFHFLPELDKYAENMNSSDCAFPRQCLCLLIHHLKEAYSATSQRLESILQHGHITYDLLLALFKPGCQVYTTCLGTKEPRCVIFDAGEEITQNDET